jgi:predicted ATPase/class 3 adenylate cyclase
MTMHPTGTVTFLFTDIEGSTRLWRKHPEAMKRSHARHNEIVRACIESHSGYVFQEIGDAFCAAFHKAGDAVKAALQAQTELTSEAWGEAVIKVRMGIHTGEAELKEDGQYNGYMTLSRTQRLMSAGHGGQVLISLASEELIRDDPLPNIELRDLGERRLKDLIRPKRIFQLVAPNLRSEFPPLKTLDAFPNNLPLQLTSFIGREKEIAELKETLTPNPSPNRRGESRLVTLTGSGGTGKTRLSLQVAADLLDSFPNGVWFVELAPLSDPDLIPQTVLSTLGISEQKDKSALAVLQDYLQSKKLLLVLDNCEHLITHAAEVANAILSSAPGVKILASSREALGVRGELSWHVPSLSLPDPKKLPEPEALTQYEAVRLFIDRAMLVHPAFTVTKDNAPAIAQICFRLDGIPLALELAAARIRMLSVEQISARLDDRFRLLTGGARTALPRQQTLRAAIDWSYDLLSENERLLLRRLAVFAGGWTLELAEQTCSDEVIDPYEVMDMLGKLVDKSLVAVYESVTGTRYRILETVRQYAREKLFESGEGERMRDQHLKVFVELAEQAEPEVRSHNQLFWLNRLDEELENLRAALEWAEGRDNESLLKLSSALWRFNFIRDHFEDIEWLVTGLTLTEGMKTTTRAYALARAGWAKAHLDNEQVEKWLDECMSLCQELDFKPALAIAIYWREYLNYHRRNDKKRFLELVQPAIDICTETNDHWLLALIYIGIGELDVAADQFAPQVYFQKSLEETRISGDKRQAGFACMTLSYLSLMNGDTEKADMLAYDAMEYVREINDKTNVVPVQHQLACVLLYREDYDAVRKIALELYDSSMQENEKVNALNALELLCYVEWAQGNALRFREYADECVALTAQANTPSGWLAYVHTLSGISHRLSGGLEKANEKIAEALKIAHSRSMLTDYPQCFEHKGFIHIEHGRFLEGVKLLAVRDVLRTSLLTIYDFFPFQIREREAYIAKARAALGDEAFEKAWAEGAALSTEEAVRLALGEEA